MTTTPLETDSRVSAGLVQPRLPRWAEVLVGAMALAISGLVTMLLGWSLVGGAALAVFLFVIGIPIWSVLVEGRRAAADRFATTVVWGAFAVVLVPLIWLIWLVVRNGAAAISWSFLN